MMRLFGLAVFGLSLAILVSLPVMAAGEAVLTVAGVAILQRDIIDARAIPDVSGQASILITLEPAAAKRLNAASAANVGKEIELLVGTKVLMRVTLQEPLAAETLAIAGPFSIAEAEKLALDISGKPPLPDDLEG
jgi:preprotein translocase subunit SecD